MAEDFEQFDEHDTGFIFGTPILEAEGSISEEDRKAMAKRMAQRIGDMQDAEVVFGAELHNWDGDLSELESPDDGEEK